MPLKNLSKDSLALYIVKYRPGSKNYTADYLSLQPYTDTDSKESNDLADHVYYIQTPKEHTEVTLVYSDEDEIVVAAATEPVMLPVDISFETLLTKQKMCLDFKHLCNNLQTRQVPDDPLLPRIIVAEAL